MSGEESDSNWSAKGYIQSMVEVAQKAEREAARSRRQPRRKLAPLEEPDLTDPLALIVEAIRDNSDAIKAATTEMTAARNAMAEAERKAGLRANATAVEMHSLTSAVQILTVSQSALERLKSDRYMWVLGGVMIGAVLASIALNDIPILWQRLFG